MGAKKIAAVVVLIVVIVFALVFIAKRSGLTSGGPTPPQWVLEQPIERIDMNGGEVVTKQYQEWEKLGHKDGMFKNPTTGTYTMVSPMTCAACGAKIPSPPMPADMAKPGADPAGMETWRATLKCPKCGKSPFARGLR